MKILCLHGKGTTAPLFKLKQVAGIQDARKWLVDYISKNGPYDAVIIFSQGSAICICDGAPLAILKCVGYSIPAEVKDRGVLRRKSLAMWSNKLQQKRGQLMWRGSGESWGEVKTRIPTVHVYGGRDPGLWAGLQRKAYDHEGGHDILRFSEVSRHLAELVRWVLREGDVF
ncbi:hypothetical protein BDV29DRAFT_195202 [Aspergillus leporis]|uniref:Serine hydrolase domain-containing protein n=1 Tax=Aspergillus leporis TaxID=41062 RepID=A0A5N5WL77_9EURO|nr:hypothetical protein BDV29DRAFT_195202 [Aspergillus leporis]